MMRERFLTTLTRSAALAAALGVVLYLVLPRRVGGWWAFLDAFSLAFCFTLLGHYVEVILLMIPDIQVGLGRVVRLSGWFGGLGWVYEIGRRVWLVYRRSTPDLPPLGLGGGVFVVLEVALDALLRGPRQANLYY